MAACTRYRAPPPPAPIASPVTVTIPEAVILRGEAPSLALLGGNRHAAIAPYDPRDGLLQNVPHLCFSDAIAGHHEPYQLVTQNAFNREIRVAIAHSLASRC